MLDALLERLIQQVMASFGSEIDEARAAYFQRCGEPFQDEPSYEARLRNFVEWYLFDRPLMTGLTPFESFMADARQSADDKAAFVLFRDQIHSLFLVEKIGDAEVIMRDLWTDKVLQVGVEVTAGYEPGAVIETRLVASGERFLATFTHIYHTKHSAKFIVRRARVLRRGRRVDAWDPFILRVNYLQLKAERYKHVESSKIYREILSENDIPMMVGGERAA